MPTTAAQQPDTSAARAGTANMLGGETFDPAKWLVVPAKTFEGLKVGDVFCVPGRTLTDAHTSEFQAVSVDTRPRHCNAQYAKAHGMPAALVRRFVLERCAAKPSGR